MIRTVVAIAAATLKEWIRSRAYVGSVVTGAVMCAAAPLLGELAGGESVRVFVDFGTALCGLATGLGVAGLVLSSMSQDVHQGGIVVLASRPVSRAALIAARAIAACTAVIVSNAFLGAILAGLSLVGGGSSALAVWGAVMFTSLEAWILAAVALAMASGSSGSVAVTGTVLFFLLGRLSGAAADIRNNPILENISVFLPRLDRFYIADVALGAPLPDDIGARAAYGFAWTLLLIVIGMVRFSRRDLA